MPPSDVSANDKRKPEVLAAICNALTLEPHTGLETGAKAAGVTRQTIYNWQRQSAQDEANKLESSPFNFEWIGVQAFFHRHLRLARELSIQGIDAKLREMALVGTTELSFNPQTGLPHWEVDPKVAADSLALDDEEWQLIYDKRQRGDIYKRDAAGSLIQLRKVTPPNPNLLVKAAQALLPKIYGEHVSHDHNITVGGVVRHSLGASRQPAMIDVTPTRAIEDQTADDEEPAPSNIFAVSERLTDPKQSEELFGGKRMIEAILFRREDGTLWPPDKKIVIVKGSSVHEKYLEAGLEVEAVDPQPLLDEGFCNSFLLKLAKPEQRAALEATRHDPPPRARPAAEAQPMFGTTVRDTRVAPVERVIRSEYAQPNKGEQVGYGKVVPGGYPAHGGRGIVR